MDFASFPWKKGKKKIVRLIGCLEARYTMVSLENQRPGVNFGGNRTASCEEKLKVLPLFLKN
jgi:hypothetical protein